MASKSSKSRRVSLIGNKDAIARVYQGLQEMYATFESEEVPEDQSPPPDAELVQRTIALMEMIQTRMEGIKTISSSRPRQEEPDTMNVALTSELAVSLNLDALTNASKSAGEESFTSSSWLYKHLQMLQDLVSRSSDVSARLWIDAFFFRVDAMIPEGQRMILTHENACDGTPTTLSSETRPLGEINYTAIVTPEAKRNTNRDHLSVGTSEDVIPSGFFVTEAKLNSIGEDIPQAAAKMYARAKRLRQEILRGALTNGLEWIFIIMYVDEDGDGATYKCSETVNVSRESRTFGPTIVKEPGPDIIAGILSHWVMHPFSDLDEDDWFQPGDQKSDGSEESPVIPDA